MSRVLIRAAAGPGPAPQFAPAALLASYFAHCCGRSCRQAEEAQATSWWQVPQAAALPCAAATRKGSALADTPAGSRFYEGMLHMCHVLVVVCEGEA
jgi:hypothetical protein